MSPNNIFRAAIIFAMPVAIHLLMGSTPANRALPDLSFEQRIKYCIEQGEGRTQKLQHFDLLTLSAEKALNEKIPLTAGNTYQLILVAKTPLVDLSLHWNKASMPATRIKEKSSSVYCKSFELTADRDGDLQLSIQQHTSSPDKNTIALLSFYRTP